MLTYDPLAEVTWLVGGSTGVVDRGFGSYTCSGAPRVAGVWSWNGDGWTHVKPIGPNAELAGVAVDETDGGLFVMGGCGSAVLYRWDKTPSGAFTATGWAALGLGGSQPRPGNLAFDRAGNAVFLSYTDHAIIQRDGTGWADFTSFGGRRPYLAWDDALRAFRVLGWDIDDDVARLWLWAITAPTPQINAQTWSTPMLTPQLQPRRGPAVSFDSLRSGLYVYGGAPPDGGPPLCELHRDLGRLPPDGGAFVGAWARLGGCESGPPWPPPLLLPSMVYDARRDVHVLFGGRHADGGLSSELWEYRPTDGGWARRR